ncbi:unnamed protein product [Mytilus edulis]|uniref:Vwde helical domain-containing protein n=1 Tax=Mytilus edulis TaxID=6550 RepID=A0A8S3UII7_MYTED|nr:unnamed protein product [Mytilus edulis]
MVMTSSNSGRDTRLDNKMKCYMSLENIYDDPAKGKWVGKMPSFNDLICKHLMDVMGYRTCYDKILDVRKFSKNEKLYTIFFPTGTKVVLTTSVGYMNVEIKASVHDYKKNTWLVIKDAESNLFRLDPDTGGDVECKRQFCDCPDNEPTSNDNVNMTAVEALKYCNDIMGTRKIFKACDEIPNVLGDAALSICALDIQLTNSVKWTKSTMETFKSNCIGELLDNSTLHDASGDRPSIAQTIQDILCPGFPECTNNGKCINGTCECDEGFVASDCSTDKSVPPDVYGVLGDGLCDLSEIECDTAFVVGEDIGSSAELSCKITEYEISELGRKSTVSTWIANATLETIMEVHCPLYSSTRRKREVNMGPIPFIKGYSMGISYDKKISEKNLKWLYTIQNVKL